jgi:RHS repeat-associated protein
MIDTNGNQITSVANSGGTTFTDTVGRQVTIANDGSVSYRDSNGNPQTARLTFTQTSSGSVPTFPQPQASSCSLFGQGGPNGPFLSGPPTTLASQAGTGSLTIPDGAGGLIYQFSYDDYGRLTKIVYPSGGYTRYSFSYFAPVDYNFGAGACSSASISYVSSRFQCRNSSGSCGSEDVTTYTQNVLTVGSSGSQTSGSSSLDVIDASPAHNKTNYLFSYATFPGFSDHETQRQYFAGSSTLLKTVATTYGFCAMPDCQLPATITTTLNDISPNLQSAVSYTYQTIATPQTVDGTRDGPLPIDIPLNVSEMGFDGTVIRTTTNTLLSGSSYAENQLHILNRISSTVVTDPSTSNFSKTVYEYDNYTQGLSPSAAIQHVAVTNSRGNVTAVTRNISQTTALPSTRFQYDDAGNVISMTDPMSHTTSYSYADVWGNSACAPPTGQTATYITTLTNPLNQMSESAFNSCTGTLASAKDQNDLNAGRLGTVYTYDSLTRKIAMSFPDTGQISFTYSDVAPFTITSTKTISANPLTTYRTATIYDGFNRVVQSQVTSDPQGTVFTDTTYDEVGQTHSVSNPYRSGSDPTSSPGLTIYAYDALGRKISETYPDASALTTSYCGSSTLVKDPTGRWRRGRTDALGRLVEVDEPNSTTATVASTGCPGTGEPIWVTSYSYDTLGNLKSAVQNGSHQRAFTYDSLSRMLTSNNPEVGAVTYTYDADGNVATKTDARNITTTYGYDVLNRETGRTFSNSGPSVTTAYDEPNCLSLAFCSNVGHRTSMADAMGSEVWAYQVDSSNHRSVYVDQRSNRGIRVLRTQPIYTKTATYFLDLAGNITQAIYPTGRTVNYTYDAANRPITAADASNGITYATGFQTPPSGTNCLSTAACYTPQGTFYALSIGQSSTFTGLNLKHTYNSRLQPNEFSALSSAGNAIDISYNFVDPITLKDAGHVYGITNNLDTTRSQIFTYDQLNRITGAQTSSTFATSPGHCWSEVYGIDPWANLQSIAATTNSAYTGCSQESGFTKVSDGNNHFTDFSYDLSGNTANDGVNLYTWNSEGQLGAIGTSTQGTTYAYDGDGRRLAKEVTSSSCVCPGGGGGLPPCGAGCSKFTSTSIQKMYWYGARGEILAETDGNANTTSEYIYFGGQRIAMIPFSGTPPVPGNPLYYVDDFLGSSRVLTQSNGTLCYDADFYPYGGERLYANTCPQNYKFEGKERDSETGNDDFGARYYSNRFGRWMSPDSSAAPAPVPYANFTNPQTLNLYAMVFDDPESFVDLDGHCELICVIVVGAAAVAAGYALYKGHQHLQEMQAHGEKAQQALGQIIESARDPNGPSSSQVDLDAAAQTYNNETAAEYISGAQAASDLISGVNGIKSAATTAINGVPSGATPSSPKSEKAMGNGMRMGTKGAKAVLKPAQENPGVAGQTGGQQDAQQGQEQKQADKPSIWQGLKALFAPPSPPPPPPPPKAPCTTDKATAPCP